MIIRGASSNVPLNSHHSVDRRTVLVTPAHGCVSEFLIATHVPLTTIYTPGCSISPAFSRRHRNPRFLFVCFSTKEFLRFDPEGDFERQRRLALKIHYDNINTESISMAPAHSILFWVDGISAEGIKEFKNLRMEAVTRISFRFGLLMDLHGSKTCRTRRMTVLDRKCCSIDCSSSNGSSNCGPSCSRWPPALISCGIYKRTWNLERLRNPLRLLRCDAANWYRLIVCLMNYSLIFSAELMINCVCLACHEWDLTCSFVRRALLLRLCS